MKNGHNDKIRARHLASIYAEFLTDYINEVTQHDTPEVKNLAFQLFKEGLTKNDKR